MPCHMITNIKTNPGFGLLGQALLLGERSGYSTVLGWLSNGALGTLLYIPSIILLCTLHVVRLQATGRAKIARGQQA